MDGDTSRGKNRARRAYTITLPAHLVEDLGVREEEAKRGR